MNEPIQFPHKPHQAHEPVGDDDAIEVTLDESRPAPTRLTRRLPPQPDLQAVLSEALSAPLALLPPETRAHLRSAGRELTLTFAGLSGTLLKGAAIALNIAAETLQDYTARNSTPDAARRKERERVEIEIE